MNSFSFTSQEDHHEKHCLDQEIGLDQLGSWRDNSQDRPNYEAQLDGVSEFDISMERRQNELSRSFSKQINQPRQLPEVHLSILQIQQNQPRQEVPILLPNNKDQQLISQATAEQENEQIQGQPCTEQEAATFFQQSNPSETVVRDSIVQQKWQHCNGNVLNEFAYMNQHVYNPLLNNFKSILDRTRIYSDKSVSNLDMYCLFFRIKLEQEQKRCQNMQNGKSKLAKQFNNNLLLDEVYLNQKSVVLEMVKRVNSEADRLAAFCQPLQQASNKIKNLLSKTIENRKRQLQNIETQLENIVGIQNQIIYLVTHPPSLQNGQSWFGKGDMRSDRYLQRRYLVQRQHLFLDLLQNTGDKLVTLLNSIFVKEEPVIHAVITKEMERYRKLSDEFYGKTEKQSLIPSKKISPCDFNVEIFDILRGIIPKEWYEASKQQIRTTQSLVQQLNNYLDDQIFLSSIQIDNTHILFTAEARWITQSSQHEQQSSKTQISMVQDNDRQNSPSDTQSPKAQCADKKSTSNMAINVILTIDRYLHMECGQKIASLKLKKLKLSRKGKAIQVSERNHSITNLFTSPIIFGELLFVREEDAQKFIKIVLSQK